MDKSNISVIKASGKKEPFSEKKIRRSIRRAKIPKHIEKQVIHHIKNSLYDGISTSEIYQHIIEYIGKSETPYHRASYSLKQAIMQLGPSGYPFEKFFAAILDRHGYKTQTNIITSGKCVEHEIDIVASKHKKQYLIECKFHNQPGTRSDIKVALYTFARFQDIRNKLMKKNPPEIWLVTNTKATTEAIKYAKCVGMHIIGWNYPRAGNLQELISDTKLQPITCLSSLSPEQKKQVLNSGLVLCRNLLEDKQNTLQQLGLNNNQRKLVKEEIAAICSVDNKK